MRSILRGDIFFADLGEVIGSEQGGTRPVLILQNDTGNRHSPTTICAPLTSKLCKSKLPTHVLIKGGGQATIKDSVVLLEQLRTIDKSRLREKIGKITPEQKKSIDSAMKIELGLS